MLALTLLLSAAQASSGFPADIQGELGMACAPQCTVCHTTNGGGGGTVTSAFGMALLDRGLEGGGQEDLLFAALAQLDADGVDSDNDGTSDIDALTAGDNPNGGDPYCGDTAPPTPVYGCFNHTPGIAGLGIIAAIAAGTRRRRR